MRNRFFVIFSMSASFLLTVPTVSFAQHPVNNYYNRNLVEDLCVLDTLKGDVELKRVLDTDGRLNYLEISSKENAFTGKVGISIPVPQLKWWWQFAHWWEIEIEAVWTPTRATSDFCINCIDKEGQSIERVVLIKNPSPNVLGFPSVDIDEFTNNMTPQKYSFPLVAVPKAKTSQPERYSENVELVMWFTDWFGTAKIKSLKIRPFNYTQQMQNEWKSDKPCTIGGLPWFNPAYLGNKTAISTSTNVIHETLRDTGHKLLFAIGIKSMRYFALWDEIETIRGQYDFDSIDNLIDELEYYGMNIGVMTVHGIPDWAIENTVDDIPDNSAARKATWDVIFPPANWCDYEQFVYALVRYFKNRVKVWEVMNEPNAHVWAVRSAYKSYAQFLMRFYTEAKRADPNCTVLCGRVGWWIHALLRDGMGEYMDAVTLHPYPGTHGGMAKETIDQFKEMQLSLMAAGKKMPIEVTEFGLGASYPWTGPGAQSSERSKADALYQILSEMKKWTSSIYWYIPIQANRQYGLIQFESDRYRPIDSYWSMGKVTNSLTKEGGPVKAQVSFGDEPVAKGEKVDIKLTAHNTSNKSQYIKFWPVGFIDKLGMDSLENIRKYDWQGTLEAGQKREINITIIPQDGAYDRYPIGLVVINELGNSLALKDLHIASIACTSAITASSCDRGTLQAVNDMLIPVWSGDEDVPALVWSISENKRNEWVQMDFNRKHKVNQVDIYWFADPIPDYAFRGRKSEYLNGTAEYSKDQLIDAHGMEVVNPSEEINVRVREYDNFSTPNNWKLFYRNNAGQWEPMKNLNSLGIEPNKFNTITFEPIETDALRVEIELKAGKGGGIHEWRVH